MTEDFMCCNYDDCFSPITKIGLLTRCSHVFCKEHSHKLTSQTSSKIKCVSCNEVINRNNDIIKFNTNPSDLILCCVKPEKALEFASKSVKLWSYQMKIKKKIQIQNVTEKYDKMAYEATIHLQTENKDLKGFIQKLEQELEKVNDELLVTKRKLNKYKAAYEASKKEKYTLHQNVEQSPFNFMKNSSQLLASQHSEPDLQTFFNNF